MPRTAQHNTALPPHLLEQLLCIGQRFGLLDGGCVAQGKDGAVAALHLQVLIGQDGAEVVLAWQL